MKSFISLALASFLTFGSIFVTNAADLVGWQNIPWGISEASLKKRLGNDIEPVAENSAADQKNEDIEKYKIQKYNLVDTDFTVSFAFSKATSGLSMVIIRDPNFKTGFVARNKFDDLEKSLVAKYGSPSYKNDKDELYKKYGSSLNLDRAWIIGSTKIELSYAYLSGLSLTTITYSPTQGGDSSKL